MSKKRSAVLLIVWAVICVGIYIAAVKAYFQAITPIYMALTVLLAACYLPLAYANAKIKAVAEGESRQLTDEETAKVHKRMEWIKYILILFIPLLVTLIGDYLYITFLKDFPLIESIVDLMNK